LSWIATVSRVVEEDRAMKVSLAAELDEEVITLSSEQLNWLLDGYDVWSAPHRMLRFTHVS